MVYNRTGYAPWSLTRAAGVQSATVDGTIEVPQYIQPVLDTGFVDERGNWKGIKSSDETFNIRQVDEAIAGGAAILTPSLNADGSWPLDMTGYTDLFIALNTSRSGNYEITAVMGPSGNFANLTPLNDATTLKGSLTGATMGEILNDSSEALTAGKWCIFIIQDRLRNQKHLQFKVTNNSGGEAASIETAFMRLV